MTDRAAFLQTTELLRDMAPAHLEEIGNSMQEMVFKAGTTVFEEGDSGDALYLVVEGQLLVTSRGVVLFQRGAGACLGEMALIDDSPRSASLIAETEARLLRWSRRDFLNAITEKTHIAFGLFKILNTNLRQDVKIQADAILELENRVREKTRELEAQNRALEDANAQVREATERKSAFLASMSHELRTPMNAIKGFTSLVLRRRSENLTDQQRENLGKVTQASDHLLAMINDLLDLSKIEAGRMDVNPTQFRVEHLIATCVSTVSPLVKDGVSLSYECDNIGQAHTDEARLRQMIINLLSNAIKFTDVGEVKVTAKMDNGQWTMDDGKGDDKPQTTDDEAFQRANVQRSNAMLVIAVSDTGKGIPKDELPFIFDEYRQVKGQSESSVQKGTGLGLSITKKFAVLLGGAIDVKSEIGKGSIFTVYIPTDYNA